jgi:glycosyltransferase involved in cell wall biosynthesis
MKIALVTDSYIPAPNGTSISVEILRRSLIKAGHDVWVFAPEYRGLKIKEERIISLPGVFAFPDKYRPKIWPTSHPKTQVLREVGFDIVHSHHFYSPYKYSYEFAKDAGAKLVTSFYRHFPEYETKKSSLSLTTPYEKSVKNLIELGNAADAVFALSRTSKKYLQEIGISNRIEVAPVGIFTKDYASYPPQAIYEKFKIPHNRKLLLYVARLENDAGLEFLLKAFKLIWKAVDDVQLMIVGGGSLENELRELISRNSFGDYVTITGFLPKNQVNKMYGVADIFVYPKTLDPEPLAVIESLAAGTPVVAVEGSASDFMKHNEEGIITDFTIESFSRGIIELLRRDKLRLELKMRSRIKAREFRASNSTHFLLELYDSVITGKEKTQMF